MTKEELKPIDVSKYKVTETGQVLKMTKEELEKEAEEFTDSKKSFWRQGRTCIDSVKQAYIAGAEPREKRIAELEAQIEKMKCCENCAWWYKLHNGQRDCAETCENRDNWSLRR